MPATLKKIGSFLCSKVSSLRTSLKTIEKQGFSTKNLRFNKKAKGLLAIAIIAILLVSIFAFLPKQNNNNTGPKPDTPISTNTPSDSPTESPQTTPNPTSSNDVGSQIFNTITNWYGQLASALTRKPPGVIESNYPMNSTAWEEVAANAWNYFQPGIGVDPNTGLPRGGGTDSPNFTDWDLGVYIQAVIDAYKTGVIGSSGAWNSSQRLETVVKFLETRELNSTTNNPFWFYQAKDGKDYHANSDRFGGGINVVDTGRLLVALNNLRQFNASLASRINDIVLHQGPYNNRTDYSALVPTIKASSLSSTSIYSYYIDSGFASFWPNQLDPNQVLNNILNAGNVTTPEGAILPLSSLSGDPLMCSIFELGNNSQLMTIAKEYYLAHEAYYNATDKYRAFSEGPTLSDHWAYEWAVLPDNRTWVVLDENNQNFNISPVIYTKISISFLAVYNTTFARNMAVYLEGTLPNPVHGYGDGVDESGQLLSSPGLNTNGMILGAANYAIQNNP